MNQHETKSPGLLVHGGEMGKLIREFDWSHTSLGPAETWPLYIKTSVQLCLDSLFPLALWIGPEFSFIYNDACRPALGRSKHPLALGQPGEKIWPEIWDTIGPMLEHVMKTGESTWEKDQLLLLDRHGYLEETYWTYSYSPIRNDHEKIIGVFSVVKETTGEVINNRHLRMLREMGKQIVDVKTTGEVYEKCLQIINWNTFDFPFILFYRVCRDGSGADLIGSAGITRENTSIPGKLEFSDNKICSGNFLMCYNTNKPVMVHDLQSRLGKLPGGYWKIAPEEAILLPISLPGAKNPKVIIVAGVNPHKKLTAEYASFYELVADQINTEIIKIKSFEEASVQALKIAEIQHANEQDFRQMANSIPQIVWVADPDGNVYFHNDQWINYTGLSSEESKVSGWKKALYPDDLSSLSGKWQNACTTKTVFESEYRLRGADKIYRWFLARALPAFNEEGRITKWYGSTTNIHEKRKLEEKIKESENIFRKLVDLSPSSIAILSAPELIVEQANRKYFELVNMQPEEVIGHSALELFPAIREKGQDKILLEAIKTGEPFLNPEYEVDMGRYGKEGNAWFTILFQPLQNADGITDKIMVVSTDITPYVQLRKNVEHSERKMKLISDAVPQLVWIANDRGEVKYYNNRIQEYGYCMTEDEKGYEWDPMIHKDDIESTMAEWQNAVKNRVPYQKEHRLKMSDGTYEWHLSRAFPEREIDGQTGQWYGTATNIHELKVSAEKYKESSSRLLLAIASTQMGTWDYNPVTDELTLSDRTREIFNFPDDEKIDMMDLYDTIIENDRAHVISSIQYALMLISEGNLDLEFSIKEKGLSKEKNLKLNGKTFFDEKGNAYRFVGTVLDITEQKRFSEELESRIELRTQELKMANEELMKINSKIEKSNKELESFTYIASHDLQEPLRKILFFSDIIQKNNNTLNGTETYFNKISDSAKRMSDLISGLLQYSTISHSNDAFINVDLNTILQHTREDYEILIVEKGATILSDSLPVVRGNKVQLGQIMTNLISNALKFTDRPPVINIEYRLKKAQELEHEFHSPHTVFHEITIRDNGIGFEKQYCDQIFVIFQRLHNRTDFPGMGLGLALCKKIIENHQGSIHVKSIPGEGSFFTIYLPV